jgi:hypothetical protein
LAIICFDSTGILFGFVFIDYDESADDYAGKFKTIVNPLTLKVNPPFSRNFLKTSNLGVKSAVFSWIKN